MARKLRITQKRSIIGQVEPHKRTIKALGLGRPGYAVEKSDTPQIRGMIRKVVHLIAVEEIK